MLRKFRKICRFIPNYNNFRYSYHHFYLASKGNQFKNKSVLIEAIHKMKQEKIREKQLAEQRDARRVRNAARKEKRVNRKLEQMGLLKKSDKEEKAPKKEEAPKEAKKGAEKKQAAGKGKDQPAKQA